jgi:acetyl-CoA C-acetyltransferase
MTDDVYVLGGAIMPFGRHDDGSSWRDWARRVGREALADAAIGPEEIDAVVVGTESEQMSLQLGIGAVINDELGLPPRPFQRVEAGGASGAAAVLAGFAQIRAGLARSVLVVGVEAAASHLSPGQVAFLYGLSFDADMEGWAGVTPAVLYALSIREHMARHGTTERDMAEVSVKNHGNALKNPWAHLPMAITVDDVIRSPQVATPYKRLDCSPLSDGVAAVVLSSRTFGSDAAKGRVRIAGVGSASDFIRLGDRPERHRFAAKAKAAKAAYAMAGIDDPARDIDIVELYDAFSGAELQALEDLGLATPGKSATMLKDGRFAPDGQQPVNLSGGLIGQGGAPGATGIAQIVTLHRLLSGRYWPGLQPVRSLRFGMADCHGGIGTISVVHVLERVA